MNYTRKEKNKFYSNGRTNSRTKIHRAD